VKNLKNLDENKDFDKLMAIQRRYPRNDPMKANKLPKNSYETNQILAKLATRGTGISPGPVSGASQLADQFKQAFAGCFSEGDDDDRNLKDEFSAKTIEEVVVGCREILAAMAPNGQCWLKLGEFLDEQLWKFSRLKEDLAQAEKEVKMVQMKLGEARDPMTGEMSVKRVMACQMLLAEKEMRRDHLQGRVSMIIDGFVGRILAGTQNEPGGEVLELRLRGVFGAL
jgi:hypothetical protein